MDIMILSLAIGLFVLVLLLLRIAYLSGFVAGSVQEVQGWLDALDKLKVPNWQSLPIVTEDATPEQVKRLNQLYVSAYALALYQIRIDVVGQREGALKANLKAKEEK